MSRVHIAILLGCSAALPAFAQYPGRVSTNQPTGALHLRSTAVLEYTGDALKDIKASRLVPIAIWDGMQYQPGGLYLAQPAPLAVLGGTQYELESDGRTQGFFDVKDSENLAGGWIGVGQYQAPPAPKAIASTANSGHAYVIKDADKLDPDKPHFAHRPTDDTQNGSTGSQTASDNSGPTLHPRANSGSSPNQSSDQASNPSSQQSSQEQVDPDRPTFHRRASPATSANSMAVDPNRPHLSYTTPESQEKLERPDALFGIPPDMQQIAGVSDSNAVDTQSFAFSWSNPGDEQKMQDALEKAAQQAIGPVIPSKPGQPVTSAQPDKPAQTDTAAPTNAAPSSTPDSRPSLQGGRPSLQGGTPPSAPAKPAPPAVHHKTKRAAAPQKPQPAVLQDVQFKVYGLTFGGGATMILSAHTASDPEKYVTIIAQPDFYGNPQILLKQVSSADNLDATPQMRLIDAVDTQGNGRGDLIFELRGQTFRQFAIYQCAGGQASRVFLTQPTPTQPRPAS